MFQWLSRVHEWATRNPILRVEDPVLGALSYNESWWECRVHADSGPVLLRIGGKYEPDPDLVATARDTFGRIDDFSAEVKEYLKAESDRTEWREFADEISSLQIHDIAYGWPKKPQAGMIFFDGPNEYNLWHCDIDSGRLFGLAFDS